MPSNILLLEMESQKISALLPNIGLTQIMNYMENLPEKYHVTLSHLRVPLTLSHFLNVEENNDYFKINSENLRYAYLIHDLFPMYSVGKIMKKLQQFGSISERPKLILRNILRKKKYEKDTNICYIHNTPNALKDLTKSKTPEVINSLSPNNEQNGNEIECLDEIIEIEPKLGHNHWDQKDPASLDVILPIASQSDVSSVDSIGDSEHISSNKCTESMQANMIQCMPSTSRAFSSNCLPIIQENMNIIDAPFDVFNFDEEFSNDIKKSDKQIVKSEESDIAQCTNYKCENGAVDFSITNSVNKDVIFNNGFLQDNSSVVDVELVTGHVEIPVQQIFDEAAASSLVDPSTKPLETSPIKCKKHGRSWKIKDPLVEPTTKKQRVSVYSTKEKNNFNNMDPSENAIREKVVFKVMEIFTDADPNYIRDLVYKNQHMPTETEMIDLMLNSAYRKRELEPVEKKESDIKDQIAFAMELLPDIDPNYLMVKLSDLNQEDISIFISEALEKKNYPTLKDYNRRQQLSAQRRQYMSEFSVENFVKLVPDPKATFANPNRVYHTEHFFIRQALRNKFERVPVRTVDAVLAKNNFQPYKTKTEITSLTKEHRLKSKRVKTNLDLIHCDNIPLLQEIAYILHEDEINGYIEKLALEKKAKRKEVKNKGLMVSCCCCFDDEVLPEESYVCTNNCIMCHQCIIKSTEVAFGEGRVDFQCLGDCGIDLNLNTLQDILPPNMFSKIAQKKAVAEVKAAGIENLEFCPFCDFATIPPGPPEEFKIFVCQNPDCLKETCRLCKEQSHIPLHCDEIEKDEDVKKRVFIENKMTDALLRKCWKCGVKFYKEEGCNKMTCSCGASTCYVCNSPVTDYKHFNGLGGDKTHLCPLYSNTLEMNKKSVMNAAKEAKKEIGVAGPSGLKIDPTSDIDKYYKIRAKKLPREPYIDVLEQHQQQQIRQIQQQQAQLQQRLQTIFRFRRNE